MIPTAVLSPISLKTRRVLLRRFTPLIAPLIESTVKRAIYMEQDGVSRFHFFFPSVSYVPPRRLQTAKHAINILGPSCPISQLFMGNAICIDWF